MVPKQLPTEARIAGNIDRLLAQCLPSAWTIESRAGLEPSDIDLMVKVRGRSLQTATLAVEIMRSIEPRLVDAAAAQILRLIETGNIDATPVVAAAYLSPRSRHLLTKAGISYVDTTGNVRIEATSPDLFIQAEGANKDPWPQDRDLQSLRGRGAARALRAIVDTMPPFGVRAVASATGSSPATVSRVLELLEIEGLIKRQSRGPVQSVDWEEAIRRWAQDYDQTTSNTATLFLSPRGIPFVEKRLKTPGFNYAATGAFAAQRFNPVAPARAATLYVEDVVGVAEELELRETDAGANVVLLEPFDQVVFDRTLERDDLRCVAPSQLAVDLLTGPGREPSQGEEILVWMKVNEDVWRT